MIIYDQEINDGLNNQILSSSTIAYASIACPLINNDPSTRIKDQFISLASLDDADLYYVQSILVSSSWNKNDDIFDKLEVWKARHTPEDKPTNLEHDENLIIGHITANWPIDENGSRIDENIDINSIPDKFHILTGSVIYRAFTDPTLKERAENLITEIENGTKYVSMECYFDGFDYGLIHKNTGEYKILQRNNSTAYLTKYLRSYGGAGEHEIYKIGRVLRNITFSGKGFVDKPANPDSIIFTKENISSLFDKKNDDLSKSGVILNQSTSTVENIIMSEILEKQVAELGAKIDTVSSACAETVKEAYSIASELKDSNQNLSSTLQAKEEELASLQAAKKLQEEETEKMKASFDEQLEAAMKKWQAEKDSMEEESKKTKAELEALVETLAGYKSKEEEMLKKEKKMKRMAALLSAGLDNDTATSTVDKFDSIDDESFEAMTTILAAVKPSMKKEEEAMMMKPSKKMAAEEAVAALETVETEEAIELSVGSDSTESPVEAIRSELVEFVSARLSKNSK